MKKIIVDIQGEHLEKAIDILIKEAKMYAHRNMDRISRTALDIDIQAAWRGMVLSATSTWLEKFNFKGDKELISQMPTTIQKEGKTVFINTEGIIVEREREYVQDPSTRIVHAITNPHTILFPLVYLYGFHTMFPMTRINFYVRGRDILATATLQSLPKIRSMLYEEFFKTMTQNGGTAC